MKTADIQRLQVILDNAKRLSGQISSVEQFKDKLNSVKELNIQFSSSVLSYTEVPTGSLLPVHCLDELRLGEPIRKAIVAVFNERIAALQKELDAIKVEPCPANSQCPT